MSQQSILPPMPNNYEVSSKPTEQSKTPRTDLSSHQLCYFEDVDDDHQTRLYVRAEFARELETENADLRRQVEELREHADDAAVLRKEYLQRAEQAEAKLAAYREKYGELE